MINFAKGKHGGELPMEPGDFIDIHTSNGCVIARFISDEGDTITAEIGTVDGNKVFYGIPKEIVTPF